MSLGQAVYIVSAEETLNRGLRLVGFTDRQVNGVRRRKNLSRFRSHYTNNPQVYSILFHKLQTTLNADASILPLFQKVGNEKVFDYFLMAIHLLACYPTEEEAEAVFKISNVTWSNWAWDIVERISLLLPEVVRFPSRWDNPAAADDTEPIFIMTIDGVHCLTEEPTHENFSQNKKFYSHKFNTAALDYELGISIFSQRCVWVAGPYAAGTPDISIFRARLKQKMASLRALRGVMHRILADRGYRGERDYISVPNSFDSEALRYFKGRALSRHESFNGRLKNFDCLQDRFRHSIRKHKMCFNSGVVIVQISLENGSPLFIV